jgi:hypothetical protein
VRHGLTVLAPGQRLRRQFRFNVEQLQGRQSDL